ncbi:MAG: heme-binding protein [Alphaproteobacteria bacterium]|nr:heme-binding protein [Alphaproteobacteria bacterium]
MLSVKRLSLEDARVMLAGAERKAVEIGVPMCIAVTDESGNLIAFSRMNGGKVTSISIAIDKAFTAAAARRPTHVYNELCRPGSPTFGIHITNEGHFSIIGGGVPVTVDGEIVGGIGASSGTPAEDIAVAEAGIAALTAMMRKIASRKRPAVGKPAPRRTPAVRGGARKPR